MMVTFHNLNFSSNAVLNDWCAGKVFNGVQKQGSRLFFGCNPNCYKLKLDAGACFTKY